MTRRWQTLRTPYFCGYYLTSDYSKVRNDGDPMNRLLSLRHRDNPSTKMRVVPVLFCALLCSMVPASAELFPGVQAYRERNYTLAIKELRPAAEEGDAEAQFYLGQAIEDQQRKSGSDDASKLEASKVEAAKWFRRAAEQGHAEAQRELAFLYSIGEGVVPDDAEAAAWLLKAAKQGNADVQFDLANRYEKGEGVPHDEASAIAWFRKAAEQDHVDAQYELGRLLAKPESAQQNGVDAVKWFRRAAAHHAVGEWGVPVRPESGPITARKELELLALLNRKVPGAYTQIEEVSRIRAAAERGDAKSQLALALLYDLGRGGLKDEKGTQRERWYRAAAEQENRNAQLFLAAYFDGFLLGHHDQRQAAIWYGRAAVLGDVLAQMQIAHAYEYGMGVPKSPVEAARWYRTAAEPGDVAAQKKIGGLYLLGRGVERNSTEGLMWLRKAADSGDRYAQSMLAYQLFAKKDKSEATKSEAAKWYRRASEAGDPLSQYSLGEAYEEGDGVQKDYSEAMRWYQKAAENRESDLDARADAQSKIGFMYYEGKGVPKDYVQAYHLLHKLAMAGHAKSEFYLAEMFASGLRFEGRVIATASGVRVESFEEGLIAASKDNPRPTVDAQSAQSAIRWYKYSSEHGNEDAAYALGMIYYEGTMVPRDQSEASKWFHVWVEKYREYAGGGNAVTEWKIGSALDLAMDYVEAAKWYQKAADQQLPEAQLSLGLMFSDGHGVPQDYKLAVKWFHAAAQQGDFAAQFNLANLYVAGRGTPQDYVEAHKWYNLAAAASGAAEAAKARDDLAAKMSPEQVAKAQDLARNWRPLKGAMAPENVTRPRAPANAASNPTPKAKHPFATGSGFFVSSQGHVLTNQHVVSGCQSVTILVSGKEEGVAVVGKDAGNDLAILKPNVATPSIATIAAGRVKVGEAVLAVGYPLQGLLSSGPSVTKGNVSALAGIHDDSRMLQITAPVQPGNSGGPLLDESGNVVGVIVGKLDALKIAAATGTIPENVNFAIKGSVVQAFLEANGVKYINAASAARLDPTMIAERASKFTVAVECWK